MGLLKKLRKLSEDYWQNEEAFCPPSLEEEKKKIEEKKKFLKEVRNGIALVLMVVFLGGGLGLAFLKAKTSDVEIVKREVAPPLGEESSQAAQVAADRKIKVHLSGAAVRPGLYELSAGSRVDDLLMLAGGLSDEVDRDWTEKNLNLAAKLQDEDKLYIPRQGELARGGSSGQVAGLTARADAVFRKINLNTASAVELEKLPGIGPAYALKIVDYRQAHGPFVRIEDIQKVSGIGPKIFEKIREKITVD